MNFEEYYMLHGYYVEKYTKAMLVVGSNLYLPTCCSLARFSNTTIDEYFSSHTSSLASG